MHSTPGTTSDNGTTLSVFVHLSFIFRNVMEKEKFNGVWFHCFPLIVVFVSLGTRMSNTAGTRIKYNFSRFILRAEALKSLLQRGAATFAIPHRS